MVAPVSGRSRSRVRDSRNRSLQPFAPLFVSRWTPANVRRERMIGDYFPFLVYAFFAAVIPASMIAFTFLFATRPQRRVRARFLPFESGVSEGPPAQQRFTVSFYLTAMLFILFDIEIVFLYPLAIVLEQLGWFGFVEFGVFVAILAVAYV